MAQAKRKSRVSKQLNQKLGFLSAARLRRTLQLTVLLAAGMFLLGFLAVKLIGLNSARTARATSTTPISHVVVIFQENHSFDNVLGAFCSEIASGRITRPGNNSTCDGTTTGTMQGQTVPLAQAPDYVPTSDHTVQAQIADINKGAMDNFNSHSPCKTTPSICYQQYDSLSGPCSSGTCIPNLSNLATKYTISDRTFEFKTSPSWAGHLNLVTADQDDFYGNNPGHSTSGPQPVSQGEGWGCDSGSTAQYLSQSGKILVPSCVPDATGSLGPNWANYTGPHAAYKPTIFDSLAASGNSWRIYGGGGVPVGTKKSSGYIWSICPTFAECLYSSQKSNFLPAANVISDAQSGNLPTFSVVTPTWPNSQHNSNSMSQGDNWVGKAVSAIQSGPNWASTVIFISYDDCGCFYDHVNPLQYNSQWGVRVPMVIVSPYAKLGYTDSGATTTAGILGFVEKNFGLPALNNQDATAYNFMNAFCFDPTTGCTPAGSAITPTTSQSIAPPSSSVLKAQAAEENDPT
jgi:phospholipase C